MKLTRKNLSPLLVILFLGFLVGTFSWELLERILSMAGVPLSLSLGPIGLDLWAVSFFIRVNPGSLAGIGAALVLFRRI